MSGGRSYGKRRRPEPESDDDLDEEEKEALRAFEEEGFNNDLVEKEAQRKKKVEDDLDRKQKEAEIERKRQNAAKEKKQRQDEEARVRREQMDKKLAELKGGLAAASTPPPDEPKNKVVETSAQEQLAEKHPNYKTRLCTRWQTGGCSFGSSCGFAHGVEDMRQESFNNQPTTPTLGQQMYNAAQPGWPMGGGQFMPGMVPMAGYPGQMSPYMMQGMQAGLIPQHGYMAPGQYAGGMMPPGSGAPGAASNFPPSSDQRSVPPPPPPAQ